MEPLDVVFATLLGIGSLGYFSLLFVTPTYYTSFSRSMTLVLRTLYCIVGAGFLFAAYLIVRDAHWYRSISTALMCATFVNLTAIALERYWLSRRKPRA